MERLNVSAEAVLDLMNKIQLARYFQVNQRLPRVDRSGSEQNNASAQLALDMFCYRLANTSPRYMVPLQRILTRWCSPAALANPAIIREKYWKDICVSSASSSDAAVNDKTYGGKTAVITTAGSTRDGREHQRRTDDRARHLPFDPQLRAKPNVSFENY